MERLRPTNVLWRVWRVDMFDELGLGRVFVLDVEAMLLIVEHLDQAGRQLHEVVEVVVRWLEAEVMIQPVAQALLVDPWVVELQGILWESP